MNPLHPYIGSTTVLPNKSWEFFFCCESVGINICFCFVGNSVGKSLSKTYFRFSLHCDYTGNRDEPIKRMETRLTRKRTRRLPPYGNMVEKKKTQRLHCICCSYMRQMQGRLCVLFLHHLCVFIPDLFPSFL